MQIQITCDVLPFSCPSSQDVYKKDHHHKEVDDETESQDVIPENKWFSPTQSYFLPTTWRRRWSFQPCRHCCTGSGPPQSQGGSLHSRRNTVPKNRCQELIWEEGHLIVIGSSAGATGVVAGKTGCGTIQLALKDHCCQSYPELWFSLMTL